MSPAHGSVYSTQYGAMCPRCDQPVARCTCRSDGKGAGGAGGDNVVRVGRQTQGRKGKGVTVITGVPLDAAGLVQLGKELKKKCGTGGTVKAGVIEIQGDHRDRLVQELQTRGWTVRRSGG